MAELRKIAADRAKQRAAQAQADFEAWLAADFKDHRQMQRRTARAQCASCGVYVPVEPGQTPADVGHRCHEWQVREFQERQAARSRAERLPS